MIIFGGTVEGIVGIFSRLCKYGQRLAGSQRYLVLGG